MNSIFRMRIVKRVATESSTTRVGKLDDDDDRGVES